MKDFDDYLTTVLSSITDMTGQLVEVDRVPYQGIMYHWSLGDTAYIAADTLSMEVGG